MSSVQELLWCDATDEQSGLVDATDCDQHQCFLVQGKKQETNTSGKASMPGHYRCIITCAFCGKHKHYGDQCYRKQRLWAKLKNKSNGEMGKGKPQGRGEGKCQDQGKGGGCRGPDKKNEDRNRDSSGGNPNTTPGGTDAEPSGGQQNPGAQDSFPDASATILRS